MDTNIQSNTPVIPPPQDGKKSFPKLIAILVVIVTVLGYGGWYAASKLQRTQNIQKTSALLPGVDCALSGQTLITNLDSNIVASRSDRKKVGKIIARVLQPTPLILEILDSDPFETYDLGIKGYYAVESKDSNTIAALKFGDVISANLYSYLVAGVELGIMTSIGDVRKYNENIIFYNDTDTNSRNRSGLLLEYQDSVIGNLSIYRDGTAVLEKFSQQDIKSQLTAEQINKLLSAFALDRFNSTPEGVSHWNGYNAIYLFCNRYQKVNLTEGIELPAVQKEIKNLIDILRLGFVKKYQTVNSEYLSFEIPAHWNVKIHDNYSDYTMGKPYVRWDYLLLSNKVLQTRRI